MRTKFFLFCFLTVVLLLFVPGYLRSHREKAGGKDSGEEIHDYFSYEGSDPALGPGIGERIDLASLRSRDGKTLADAISGQPVMLCIVDPACGACAVATDKMRFVRNRVVPAGVPYYLVSFAKSQSQPDFFEYTDNLNVNAPAFLWKADQKLPPESLYLMVLPSHILIDGKGTVIRKWPGTDHQKAIRQKMAAQIVRDTFHELSSPDRAAVTPPRRD